MHGEPSELMLIKLSVDARPQDRERIERRLHSWGARQHVASDWGWIVQLEQRRKPLLSNDHAVAVVGGVQPSGRPLRRIRITAGDDPPDGSRAVAPPPPPTRST